MAVEWMENWGHFRDYNDLDARYALDGDGATTGTNIEILAAGGPSTTPAGLTHPRSPVPGCLQFGKNGGVAAASEAKVAFNWGGTAVNVIVGFNLFFEAEASTIGYDGIVALGEMPDITLSIDVGNTTDQAAGRYYIAVRDGQDGGQWWTSEADGDAIGDPDFHSLLYDTWYSIEFRCLLSNTVGEFEVRVDGEVWQLQTGIDTIPSAGPDTDIQEARFGTNPTYPSASGGNGVKYRVTDVYVVSVDGGGNEIDFLYPWMIDTLYPDADTAEADWVPFSAGTNVAEVDDNPQHDYDSSNNETNTNTDKDRFTTGGSVPESGLGRVMAVQVQAMARDTLDGADKTARVVLFENATEGVGTTRTLTEPQWQALWHLYEDNPDTSAAWLMADVEAAEIGYELVS